MTRTIGKLPAGKYTVQLVAQGRRHSERMVLKGVDGEELRRIKREARSAGDITHGYVYMLGRQVQMFDVILGWRAVRNG